MIAIIQFLTSFLVNSPFYPHWLMHKKMIDGNRKVLTKLHGQVLEVGAGDGARKAELLSFFQKITKYTVTDYSSWDDEFDVVDDKVNSLGGVTEIIFGYQKRGKLDVVCDAMNLPFGRNKFDFHLSFEVLEHISDPFAFFEEATRVLKPKGKIIFSVPVLFRIHGGEPYHKLDYFRYMPGFFYEIAYRNKLKIKLLYSNTGIGTTVAQMINQWLILRIRESHIIFKILYLSISIFIFPLTNIVGLLIDIKPDPRFATRYHVVLQK